MLYVSDEQFDLYLESAIESMEAQFGRHFNEVPVIVEENPSELVESKLGNGCQIILGLFQGVPLGKKLYTPASPTQITLYRRNILNSCRDKLELPGLIRKVLVHELGHYLGFSDAQLRDHGY